MASFVKFQQFVEELGKEGHNLDTDTLKILLTVDAPSVSADAVKADLPSELGTSGGYTAGGTAIANQDYEHTTGTAILTGDDVVFTATAGGFGPFRYAVLWNDTHASDGLIGYWDYGSNVTLLETETFTVD